MSDYNNPKKQIADSDSRTEFKGILSPDNRWVKMSNTIDWEGLMAVYAKYFSSIEEIKNINPKIILGIFIIKHIEDEDYRAVIQHIEENAYMQYFLGFDNFDPEFSFDSGIFKHIRRHLGNAAFDKVNRIIIAKAFDIKDLS